MLLRADVSLQRVKMSALSQWICIPRITRRQLLTVSVRAAGFWARIMSQTLPFPAVYSRFHALR